MANWVMYNKFALGQFGATATRRVDFETTVPTIKIALIKAAYTPSVDDDFFADCAAEQVTVGDTYTSGGRPIASNTLTLTTATGTVMFDAADITWTASATGFGYARTAVMYDLSGATAAAPLIAYAGFGADKGNTSGDLTLQMDGVFTITPA